MYCGMSEEEFRRLVPLGTSTVQGGACWATSLSLLLRCHGLDVPPPKVAALLDELGGKDITHYQLDNFSHHLNLTLISFGLRLRAACRARNQPPEMACAAPWLIAVEGHFVLALGCKPTEDEITYFDPWSDAVHTVPAQVFEWLGGSGAGLYIEPAHPHAIPHLPNGPTTAHFTE